MKQLFTKAGIVGVVVMFVVAAFSGTVIAESMKITGSHIWGTPAETDVSVIMLDDVPNHVLVQFTVRDKMPTSSHPDWNNIETVRYERDESIGDKGSHQGYVKHLLNNGDIVYAKFEGTHQGTVLDDGSWEGTSQGTWQYVSGTGKYKKIKGSGGYTCKGRVGHGGGCDWHMDDVTY